MRVRSSGPLVHRRLAVRCLDLHSRQCRTRAWKGSSSRDTGAGAGACEMEASNIRLEWVHPLAPVRDIDIVYYYICTYVPTQGIVEAV